MRTRSPGPVTGGSPGLSLYRTTRVSYVYVSEIPGTSIGHWEEAEDEDDDEDEDSYSYYGAVALLGEIVTLLLY